ncbi:MAG TPA: hypothetical protein VKZ63_08605 [Kofleriaceae bacterium]|nr:hypothetical protein [Kofleriaceae bacterium]
MTASRNEAVPAWLLDGRGGGRLLDSEALARWRPEDGAASTCPGP